MVSYLILSYLILTKSIECLKNTLKEKVKLCAFNHLMELAKSHSKVRDDIYKDVDGKNYLKNPKFTPDLASLLFKMRTRMFNVRNNFRNNYAQTNTLCPLCSLAEDSQEHLLECNIIKRNCNDDKDCVYDDLFSDDSDKLFNIAMLMKEIIEIREKLLEIDTEP